LSCNDQYLLHNLVIDAQHPKHQLITSRQPFSATHQIVMKADLDLLDIWRLSWKRYCKLPQAIYSDPRYQPTSWCQSALHEHRDKVLWNTNWNHLVWQCKLTTAWCKNIVLGAKYWWLSFFFNNFAWFQVGLIYIQQKKVVGTKLVWKQTCQINLRYDENMECTLAQTYPGIGHLEAGQDCRCFNFNMFHWGLNDSSDCVCRKPQNA